MTRRANSQNIRSILRRRLGPSRSTHWAVAGAIGVIILGSYLIYSNHDMSPAVATTNFQVKPGPNPTSPAPLSSER
jgi:hypothetical protein